MLQLHERVVAVNDVFKRAVETVQVWIKGLPASNPNDTNRVSKEKNE